MSQLLINKIFLVSLLDFEFSFARHIHRKMRNLKTLPPSKIVNSSMHFTLLFITIFPRFSLTGDRYRHKNICVSDRFGFQSFTVAFSERVKYHVTNKTSIASTRKVFSGEQTVQSKPLPGVSSCTGNIAPRLLYFDRVIDLLFARLYKVKV